MPNWVKKFRIFLWLILAIFFVWLTVQATVPNGRIVYNYDFTHRDSFISLLSPLSRVLEPENGTQKIIGNPVYFDLRTTRPFSRAEVTVTYRNKSKAPIVELGALVDNKMWRYDLKSMSNSLIDEAIESGSWGVVESGETLLLQKEEKYNSLKDFLNNLPPKNDIALYNYQLLENFKIANYQATTTPFVWPYKIKGGYQFYVYIKNEKLKVDFKFSNLNEANGSDEVTVVMYNSSGKIVTEEKLIDDTSGFTLTKDSLPEGAYKIEVKASSDIITEYLSSSQSKISFINRLWLTDTNKSMTFFGSGDDISFQTNNPASRQVVAVNNIPLDLNQTYRQLLSTNRCGAECSIKLGKGDVTIATDGVFSLQANNLFDPRWQKLNSSLQSLPDVKYILANYSRPETINGWISATVNIDLKKAYRDKGVYNFMISVPRLSAEDTIEDHLEIENITVELTGDNWRQILKKLFKH